MRNAIRHAKGYSPTPLPNPEKATGVSPHASSLLLPAACVNAWPSLRSGCGEVLSMMDDQEMRALTFLAMRVRKATHGAGPWDEVGVMANLRKVQAQSLAHTIEAVIRHAADPKVKSPGVIASPFTPKKLPDVAPRGPFPPKRNEECSQHVGQLPPPFCAIHANDGVRAWYDAEEDPKPTNPTEAAAAIREQLRKAKA